MRPNHQITVLLPGANRPGKYFSFKVKRTMDKERSVFKRPKKLFVISSLEGSFRFLLKLLVKAKVIDKYLRWTFDENHVVIVGDFLNSCEDMGDCLWFIYSLEEKAQKEGGYVHFILGNNEIQNLNGDWRNAHPKYTANGKKKPVTALYDGNNELWRWLCTKNVVEKIGDILFAHSAIVNGMSQSILSIPEFNELSRPLYSNPSKILNTNPALAALFREESDSMNNARLHLQSLSDEQISSCLHHFGVSTIVIGGTQTPGVSSFFNGKLIHVNTSNILENPGGLLIIRHRFYKITLNEKKEKIK